MLRFLAVHLSVCGILLCPYVCLARTGHLCGCDPAVVEDVSHSGANDACCSKCDPSRDDADSRPSKPQPPCGRTCVLANANVEALPVSARERVLAWAGMPSLVDDSTPAVAESPAVMPSTAAAQDRLPPAPGIAVRLAISSLLI